MSAAGRRVGKYKWARFVGTGEQAQKKLTELLGQHDRGEFIEPSKITVGEWLDQWLEKAVRGRRTLNTCATYTNTVTKHLKPALGHIPLQALTPLDIEHYYAQIKASPASARNYHVVFTTALNAAVNSGLLQANPTKRVTNRPQPPKFAEDVLNNVWTGSEAHRFLAYVKDSGSTQWTALFALALDSGCRKAELCGLMWKDISDRQLRVERQLLASRKAGLNFSLPKSGRPRAIDLSEESVKLLQAHRREQAELKMANRTFYRDHGLVFAQAWEHIHSRHSELGGPLNIMKLNQQLDRLCKGAGVRRLTVHGLRHTCATLLLAAGVPPHVVQKRLGHKGVEITLNLYAHVLPSMQEDAAARLATLLHG